MQQEIRKLSRQNMSHTVDNYERYFVLVRNMMNSVYFNEYVNLLENANELNYITADKLRLYLQSVQANNNLYLDNLAVYIQNLDRVIDKNGVWTPEEMFTKEYLLDDAPPETWLRRMKETDLFAVMPASPFKQVNMKHTSSSGTFFTLMTNNHFQSNITILSFSRANRLVEQFHQSSTDDRFYILDSNNSILYPSAHASDLPDFEALSQKGGDGVRDGDYFYFQQRGESTGFSYVNLVPVQSITSQIHRLSAISTALIGLSIGFGILFSLWFVRRINNPIRQMIAGIEDAAEIAPVDTRIHEFNVIHRKMQSVMQQDQELSRKNNVIRKYAYFNILKRIRNRLHEINDEVFKGGPHVFILFDITFFRTLAHAEARQPQDDVIVRIRDYIQVSLSGALPESLLFQLEPRQVLALVRLPEGQHALPEVLESIVQVLTVDRDHYIATIAVSPVFESAEELPEQYERLQKRIRQRPLTSTTALLGETASDGPTRLPVFAEEEFANLLLSGSMEAVDKVLDYLSPLQRAGGTLDEFQRFSLLIVNKVNQAVAARNPEQLHSLDAMLPYETVAEYSTLEQYIDFFDRYLGVAVRLLKAKNEQLDPISRFVMRYVEEHPEEDISLELLASKLNITSNYLSSYFKEKNHMNFSEYVNGVRLGKAKTLLLEHKDLTVQEIGKIVGFYNSNTFIRNFKKLNGLTPGEFRKQFGALS
ncbi:hypothetical protein PA598K_05127 [Paenibacillus sp. 598K]|nr:hypothetical protein PA598K_05127 [Paenibacillus sp. 598K]